MDLDSFIVAVFCLTDDWLERQEKLRQRGPKPKLSDSEVLTMEIVGKFLGIDTDKGIYLYFLRHFAEGGFALESLAPVGTSEKTRRHR